MKEVEYPKEIKEQLNLIRKELDPLKNQFPRWSWKWAEGDITKYSALEKEGFKQIDLYIEKISELTLPYIEPVIKEHADELRQYAMKIYHVDEWPYPYNGRFYDPVECTQAFKEAEKEIEPRLEEMRARQYARGHMIGDEHFVVAEKKRILKEEYGIDWKTPAYLNPHMRLD